MFDEFWKTDCHQEETVEQFLIEVNGDHFAEWFEHKLLLNLPAGAAVVMDNPPYHTVKMKESWAPTSKTLKADMQV